ncbi:MAG: Asp-tRNA(Asn)/Glu-tRNA(Gln) amidotransferase subunit GatC [Candidatus Nanoperiomorbus sp.]
MSVSLEDVRHLAELSQIRLSKAELTSLAGDIDRIVGYIDQLDELDTAGVEPTFQLTGLENVWRTDEVKPQLERRELLRLAPDSEDGQVKVPKVL